MAPKEQTSSLIERAGRAAGDFVRRFRQASVPPIELAGTYHEAARKDATTADWRAALTSADQSILDDLDTMLARSRTMIANDGYAASMQGGYRRSVVGGGITARSAARHPDTNVMLKSFNAELDALWNEYYWDPAVCDAEQTKTMPEKQQLWMNELFAAGGVFIVEDYLPRGEAAALVLQEIEYEQRDTLLTDFEGRAVRGGIELGSRHEPLAYHLYTAAHPLDDYGSKSRRVPADRCIHLYRQDRVRQRIGAPWMRPIMQSIRNLAMFDNYTMHTSRTRAAYVGFIEQPDAGGPPTLPGVVAARLSAARPGGQPSEAELAGRIEIAVQSGMFAVLKPGQKPHFPNVASPDTMYPPFVLEQLKRISAGTGLDLTTVARWYADGNFSSQRQAKLDMWAEVDWIQDILFIHKAMRRIRRRFVELNILEGRLRATGYAESQRWRTAYLTTNWQGPPKHTIDEIKDQAAWSMKFKNLIGSPQEYCNEQGKDIRDVLAEIDEFRRMAQNDYNLGDLLPLIWGTSIANQPKAGKKPADPSRAGDNGNDADDGDLAGLVARQARLQAILDDGDGPPRGSYSDNGARRL
ncbi:MAG TPA: phage portal protein [Phycisphaerae bacterium]|nr:phage portal protein [Phycisphaerae bacterium]